MNTPDAPNTASTQTPRPDAFVDAHLGSDVDTTTSHTADPTLASTPEAVFERDASHAITYRQTPLDWWRATWGRRHTVATVLLAPLMFWAYATAGASPSGVAWYVFVGGAAVGAAVIIASYLPARGTALRLGSPCGLGGLLTVWAAGLFFGDPTATLEQAIVGFCLIGVGLAMRALSPATCTPRL